MMTMMMMRGSADHDDHDDDGEDSEGEEEGEDEANYDDDKMTMMTKDAHEENH